GGTPPGGTPPGGTPPGGTPPGGTPPGGTPPGGTPPGGTPPGGTPPGGTPPGGTPPGGTPPGGTPDCRTLPAFGPGYTSSSVIGACGPCVSNTPLTENFMAAYLKSFRRSSGFAFFNVGGAVECVTEYTEIYFHYYYKDSAGENQSGTIRLPDLFLKRGGVMVDGNDYTNHLIFSHTKFMHGGEVEEKLKEAASDNPDSVRIIFVIKKNTYLSFPRSGRRSPNRSIFAIENQGVRLLAKLARYDIFKTYTSAQKSDLDNERRRWSVVSNTGELGILQEFSRKFIEALNRFIPNYTSDI
ncbi:MAG: hypothetical protein OXC44_04060, partial [Proteobacteria bacterium]|nr:hypothetical protein [Pseudomonadota bacterium]